jgi:Ca2+-binding RTX toxin-like protein
MLPVIEFRGKKYSQRIATQNGVTLKGGQKLEWLQTLGGNNTVLARGGDDVVLAGVDFAGFINDPVFGPGFIASIGRADAGNNIIQTQGGDDVVVTGRGNDRVNLGQGNNIYDGRLGGSDKITAGDGNNFVALKLDGTTTVDLGAGRNTVSFEIGSFSVPVSLTVKSYQGKDTLLLRGSSQTNSSITADLGDGENILNLSGGTLNLTTGKDADLFEVSGLNVTVNAGAGNDNINAIANFGTVTINAGDGDDRVYTSGQLVKVDLGSGNNRASVSGRGTNVIAGDGDNVIAANGTFMSIQAGNGKNQIYAIGSASVIITTGTGDDFIHVENAVNGAINAGGGNNVIQLGENFSQQIKLEAGSGADLFSLGSPTQRVTINGYGKNDNIQFSDLTGIRLEQATSDVRIFRGNTFITSVTNAKIEDINLSAGSTRAIPDSLKDPFNAAVLTSPTILS